MCLISSNLIKTPAKLTDVHLETKQENPVTTSIYLRKFWYLLILCILNCFFRFLILLPHIFVTDAAMYLIKFKKRFFKICISLLVGKNETKKVQQWIRIEKPAGQWGWKKNKNVFVSNYKVTKLQHFKLLLQNFFFD